MTKLTVDEQIRTRLLEELSLNKNLADEQRVVDEILESTTNRMEEYLERITVELGKQRVALETASEIRGQEEGLLHSRRETATLGINLSDVFFRSDVALLVKHLTLADEETIIKALAQDGETLARLRQLIQQMDEMEQEDD
jgi:hypothetical protein